MTPPTEQTRAVARLPGLDIEIVHRPPAGDSGEAIGIMLRATPSFDALAAALPGLPFLSQAALANPLFANPLLMGPFLMWPLQTWAELTEAAWRTWLGAFALTPSRGKQP
ncbi:MAG TPA: hypothetical protein VGB82_27650 [Alphaproteobacteria bacterium]